MILLILLLLFNSSAYAVSEFETAKAAIMYVEPHLEEDDAAQATQAILKHADTYNLDWRVMAAIVSQESSFRRDPQSCLKIKTRCPDLGIAQINFRSWQTELNLNRKKLLVDVDYNIEVMAKILSRIKDKHGKEKAWYTRYHSATRKHRNVYAGRINHKMLKISSYAKGYADNKQGELYSVSTK